MTIHKPSDLALIILALFFWLAPPATAQEYVNTADVTYDASTNPTTISDPGGYTNLNRVTAWGGNDVIGLEITSGGFRNRGTLTATGGQGGTGQGSSSGIYVAGGGVTNSGTWAATGGQGGTFSGSASGIFVRAGGVTNSGALTATGGQGGGGQGSGSGIYVQAGGVTNSGTWAATGGTGGTGRGSGSGIYVASGGLTNSGALTATGGQGYSTSSSGSGIFVETGGVTNSGAITATGGTGGTGSGSGSGISVYDDGFTNSGRLVLATGGTAASVYLRSGGMANHITFKSGSTLALAGGYIDATDRPVHVESGASLYSLSAAGLGVGQSLTHQDFILTTGSGADSAASFTTPTSLTLGYDLSSATNEYTATVTRIASTGSFASDNGAAVLTGLEIALSGTVDALSLFHQHLLPYFELVSMADHMTTGAAIRSYGDRLGKEMTPQGTANSAYLLTNNARRARQFLSDKLQIAGHLNAAATTPAAGDIKDGLAFWIQPFYHHGKLDGRSGYSDLKEDVFGAHLGALKTQGPWVLGFSGHVFQSDIDGNSEYDADATGYGLNLGLGRSFNLGSLNPFVELTGGWTQVDMDQTRRTSMISGLPGKYDSDVDMDIFTASLTVSNRFALDNFSLTPRIGVDYAYTDINSYTEKGTGVFALKVSGDEMNSFRSVLGLTLGYSPVPSLDLELRADYFHEFADTEATLASRSKSAPLMFKTNGQDMGRDSARLGAGVSWKIAEMMRFGLEYDFTVAERYTGHNVMAAFRMEF